MCDQHDDCGDNSDEVDCGKRPCQSWQKLCDNQICVLAAWFCDGDDDCGDGSDEESCSKSLLYFFLSLVLSDYFVQLSFFLLSDNIYLLFSA